LNEWLLVVEDGGVAGVVAGVVLLTCNDCCVFIISNTCSWNCEMFDMIVVILAISIFI
jgi:hypothetical protein